MRSRAASVELGGYVTNSSGSVRQIRNTLLDPAMVTALSGCISPSTLAWLDLVAAEQGRPEAAPPCCTPFQLDAPEEVTAIHVRRLNAQTPTYLCSTDAKVKCAVQATDEKPFDQFAHDPRFIYSRDGHVWHLKCRDPRIPVG